MNGSWHLGKLAGIDVRIHWTFLLLPAWIYLSSLAAGSGFVVATTSVIFILAIFGCVVLHELGHSLTARRFGIATRDITLLPIGGVASLERMPRNPWQELAIALAGPAVNVVIATVIFGGLALLSNPLASSTALALFLKQLAWVNVALVVFNMIPAFPMDGGRVLRSVLAMLMPYAYATNIAAGVGQVTAVGLGLLGIFSGNLMLLFVAGFVFLAARGEAFAANQSFGRNSQRGFVNHVPFQEREQFRDSVQNAQPIWIGEEIGEAIGADEVTDSPTQPIVSADWSVQAAFGWLADKRDVVFPVMKYDQAIGYVSKADLHFAIVSGKAHWPIERLLAIRFLPPSGLNAV